MSEGSEETENGGYNEEQKRILEHLRDGLERGKRYFKSGSIADATDLSPKQVGVHLGILQEDCDDLEIEKWGYSTSTTWQVSEDAHTGTGTGTG
ncbi:MAG: hypothetical protein SV760_09210 [Halobacteria archaeon]|nr:hypothetical protein [Halobacteria archaeon]